MDRDPNGRLPTGVPGLDRALDGGVEPGSLVALSAPPRTQSEPLLYAMAAANPTRYLSTLRPAVEVRGALAATVDGDADAVDVRAVDGDDVLDEPEPHLEGLGPESVLIVDPTTELEQGERRRYREFLDACGRVLRATESVGLLHCHEKAPSVLRRDMTLARADQAWNVRAEVDERVRTRLAITKRRGGRPLGTFDLAFEGGIPTIVDA